MLFGLLFGFFWLFFFGLAIASIVFWILMLVDVVKSDFKEENDKTVWVLVVALAGVIGAIIYYFVGRANKVEKKEVVLEKYKTSESSSDKKNKDK